MLISLLDQELQAMEEDGITQVYWSINSSFEMEKAELSKFGSGNTEDEFPPAHYCFKVESFSQLSKFLSRTGSEKYESHDFEVAGYKWKLSLYPNGDKKRGGSDHISLYLVLSETNNLPYGSKVNTFFRLFAYDQIRDKYLVMQDTRNKQMRFHALKTECGFSRFIPLVNFNDPSNGYLIDDCCVFGVEVFVRKCTEKGECVSIGKSKETITHTMENFSKLGDEEIKSSSVEIAGYEWCLNIEPNGYNDSKNKHLSMFLEMVSDICSEQEVWVDYKLKVKNQVGGQHIEKKEHFWFSNSEKVGGFSDFLLLSDLKDESKGYMLKDTVIVEVEFIQVVAVKDFP